MPDASLRTTAHSSLITHACRTSIAAVAAVAALLQPTDGLAEQPTIIPMPQRFRADAGHLKLAQGKTVGFAIHVFVAKIILDVMGGYR